MDRWRAQRGVVEWGDRRRGSLSRFNPRFCEGSPLAEDRPGQFEQPAWRRATETLQRIGPNPSGLRYVDHDPVGSAILQLDVATTVPQPHAGVHGRVDFASRAGIGVLQPGIHHPGFKVMDAAVVGAELLPRNYIVFELHNCQVNVSVAQVIALDVLACDLPTPPRDRTPLCRRRRWHPAAKWRGRCV